LVLLDYSECTSFGVGSLRSKKLPQSEKTLVSALVEKSLNSFAIVFVC
jgi:hypothetical protein